MLTNIIPAAWRQRVYVAYALAIVALGAIAAGFAAAQLSQPSWLIVAGAVLLYIGAAIGATAASNMPAPAPTPVSVTYNVMAAVAPDPVVAPSTAPPVDVPVPSVPVDGTPPTTTLS